MGGLLSIGLGAFGVSGFEVLHLACACVLMGFGLRSGDAALQGGRIEFD